VVGEPVGVDPQVDLERGVGALQAEIVGDQLQGVGPGGPDPEWLPAQPANAAKGRPAGAKSGAPNQPQGEQTLVKAPLEAQVVDKVEVFTVDRESHRPLQHGVSPTPNRD
jgi:hypothetical protein